MRKLFQNYVETHQIPHSMHSIMRNVFDNADINLDINQFTYGARMHACNNTSFFLDASNVFRNAFLLPFLEVIAILFYGCFFASYKIMGNISHQFWKCADLFLACWSQRGLRNGPLLISSQAIFV